MTFDTFIKRLYEVKNISRIENGYSHIVYDIIYNSTLDYNEYMLIDTSSYKKRGNRPLIIDHLCAIPDFVITNRTNTLKNIKRHGCIEVKNSTSEIYNANLYKRSNNRLIDYYRQKGYLSTYNNNVIYTNGWVWRYFKSNKEHEWIHDFTNPNTCNETEYNKLLSDLRSINWTLN